MSNLVSCFEYIIDHPSEQYVLALVINSKGSVPQPRGASMLICPSKKTIGTIGGGMLEYRSLEVAKHVIKSKHGEIFSLEMNDNYSQTAGPICGGRVDILLSFAINHQFKEIKNAYQKLQNDGSVYVGFNQHPYHPDFGKFKLVKQSSLEKHTLAIFEITRPKKLLISGGGHCGKAIAELGSWLGFETHIVDPRSEMQYSKPKINYHLTTFEDYVRNQHIDSNTSIVIVNKGHADDFTALKACINTDAKYIGMIGSKRKINLLKNEFIGTGITTYDRWEKIYAPIGVNLKAIEVKEIALSVMTEIISVFNGVEIHELQSMKI